MIKKPVCSISPWFRG